MNNYIALFLFFSLFTSSSAFSKDKLIYVNGIQNSELMARATAIKIQKIMNSSQNHLDSKRSYSVSYVWNPIGWDGDDKGSDLYEDKVELFLMKTAEEHYLSSFVKITTPFNQSNPVDIVAASDVVNYFHDMTPGTNYVEDKKIANDLSMQSTKNTIGILYEELKRSNRSIVIAHSQGNLLANLAYAKFAEDNGQLIYNRVRVLNVANVSNINVSGLNFTHAGDAALYKSAAEKKLINQSLESLPENQKWTRITPKCLSSAIYCDFNMSPPTLSAPTSKINGQDPVDKLLDHSIIQTYFSEATVDVNNSNGVVFTSGKNRFVDRFEDFVYAASESLDASNSGIKILSIEPLEVSANAETFFTISGENLPKGLGFAVNDCSPSSVEVAGGTSKKVQFKCTMGQSIGEKNGVVKNRPGGQTLFEFKVTVLPSQVGTWESTISADGFTVKNIFYKNLPALPNGKTVFAGKHTVKYGVSCDLGQDLEITIDRNGASFGITTVTKSAKTECREGNIHVYTADLGSTTIREGKLENEVIILKPWNGCDSTINNVCYYYDSIKPK